MRPAYTLIKSYYGDKKAKRSGVLFIKHIDEGLKILDFIKALSIVKDAYCLHPIFQSDEDFNANKYKFFKGIPQPAIILAMEYRRVANSYLSKDKVSDFVGFSCIEVKQMLIADKVQNYKDFLIHHYGKHERSSELYEYFHNWFNLLGIAGNLPAYELI
jgi:hypothetical protein